VISEPQKLLAAGRRPVVAGLASKAWLATRAELPEDLPSLGWITGKTGGRTSWARTTARACIVIEATSTNGPHEDHQLIQKTAVQRLWAQFWHPTA
jgi:hypothetical protein